MRNKGYVTVFTVLLMLVFMTFVMFMLELMYVKLAERKAQDLVTGNIESLFGDFHVALFEDYHLLGVDASYGTENHVYLEEHQKEQITYGLGRRHGLFALQLDDVRLQAKSGFMEDGHAGLKKQIHAYAVYGLTDRLLSYIKGQQDIAQDTEIGSDNPEASVEESIDEQMQFQDPRGMLSGLTGDLLLRTVCPADAFPSKTQMDMAAPVVDTGDSGFPGETEMQEMLGQVPFDWKLAESASDQIELAAYIKDVFGDYVEPSSQVLRAEQEYILYGAASDRDNLLKTVHALIRLRMPCNYAYLRNAPGKMLWIRAAAIAIGAATATAPTVVQGLLTGAVCYGESVLDVRALLHGEPVPVTKTDATWRLSFAALFGGQLSGRTIKAEHGLSYSDYLLILMITKLSEDAVYDRILDVITWNLQKKEPSFSFASVITKAEFSYQLSVAPHFAGWMKQKDPAWYHFIYVRKLEY